MARAIYLDRPFLFLDESMSAIDEKSENKILTSILQLNKTVVLITHKSDLLEYFDNILLIKDRKIIETKYSKNLKIENI